MWRNLINIGVFGMFCVPALAVTSVTVNCNGGAADYPSISAAITALKTLPVSGNAVITVTGSCTDNVVIDNFADLTLIGQPGAMISSPNSASAIRIDHSNKIIVRGFAIRGGNPAVRVRRGAGIVIDSCNVGNPSVTGPGNGIRFEEHAVGFVVNTSVSNFVGSAVFAYDSSSVSIQATVPVSLANSGGGAFVSLLSTLIVSGKVTVENNTGSGLVAGGRSVLSVGDCGAGEMAIRGNGLGISGVDSNLHVACPVVVENNRYGGVNSSLGGSVSLYAAVIRSNGVGGSGGAGVALQGTTFYCINIQVLNNTGPGILAFHGSKGVISGSTIQGNSTDGIQVIQGSLVELQLFASTVSGHPGVDLLCNTDGKAFGVKTGIGKMTCPGFSAESGPKPYVPPLP
ncbi:MAG: hypothetical protein HY820_31490 [Acidobacteria bacterium]|nr:hypothetical protein [Acidobacteriota bacterium]